MRVLDAEQEVVGHNWRWTVLAAVEEVQLGCCWS